MNASALALALLSAWTMYRGDPARTGVSDAVGNLGMRPRLWCLTWPKCFGAVNTPLAYDFNGDGYEQGVSNTAGADWVFLNRVCAETTYLYYEREPDNFSSAVLTDCDGDGVPEIVNGFPDGYLRAYSGVTGSPLWQTFIGSDSVPSPLAFDKYVVAMNDSGRVFFINRRDGSVLWTAPGGNLSRSSPSLGNLTGGDTPEIVQAFDSTVRVLDLAGNTLWEFTVAGDTLPTVPLADVDGDGFDEMVIHLPYAAEVSAYDFGVATPKWKTSVQRFTFFTQPLVPPALADVDGDGEIEAVVVSQRQITCLSGADGATEWVTDPKSVDFTTAPVLFDAVDNGQLEIVMGGLLFVPGESRQAILLYGDTGEILWALSPNPNLPWAPFLSEVVPGNFVADDPYAELQVQGPRSHYVLDDNSLATREATSGPRLTLRVRALGGRVVLSVTSPRAAGARLTLYDAAGRAVLRRTRALVVGANEVVMDARALAASVYVVTVGVGNERAAQAFILTR